MRNIYHPTPEIRAPKHGGLIETDEIGNQKAAVANVAACKLVKGGTVAEDVTCTTANTDYAMANAMAAGTKYLVIYCASTCKVAMGATTSATNGVCVAAGIPTVFPVYVTGVAEDDKAHAQSATAGAVVTFTSMAD